MPATADIHALDHSARRAPVRPSLSLRRRIKASPERVFEAWTDPRLIAEWWGCPETRAVPVAEFDVREGGSFRIAMQTEDGALHEVRGTYREVLPARRLVFTWNRIGTAEPETLVSVALRADGDGTVLMLTHEQFADEAVRDQHDHGWTASLDRLAARFG